MRAGAVWLSIFVAACGSETFIDAPATSAPADSGVVVDATGGLDAATDGAPPASGCPQGMVRTKHACIDAREVTVRDYEAFTTAMSDSGPGNLPDECSEKTERARFLPSGTFVGGADAPVTNIDWCDAFLYCRSVGKRLCGKIGGGRTGVSDADVRGTEWYEACSKGTQVVSYPLPAGATENEAGRCVLATSSASVVSRPNNRCEGAYPGLFDMIGNVEEWVDACDGDENDDPCLALGSAFDDELSTLDSSCSSAFSIDRRSRVASVGFRCCR